jgi:hypothetical protein
MPVEVVEVQELFLVVVEKGVMEVEVMLYVQVKQEQLVLMD